MGPFPTFLGVGGPGPSSEYLTHYELLAIQFFSNSPWDYAHWNRTAILDLGVPLIRRLTLWLPKYGDFDVSGTEHVSETQRICC